jgi:hypothetical protein
MFKPDFTSPTLLKASPATALQDYHLLWSSFPAHSCRNLAYPLSLGATNGVAVAFLSSGY